MTTEPGEAVCKPKYTIVSVVRAVVFGVVVAWILSFIYGAVDFYSPLIYLNVLIAMGMGMALGKVATLPLRRHRINGRGAALVVGLLTGITGLVFSWIAYLWVVDGFDWETYFLLVRDPFLLPEVMRYIADDPIWTLKKSAAAPAYFYFAFWIGEAALLVGYPVRMSLGFVRDNILCVECNDWVSGTEKQAVFAVPAENADDAFQKIRAHDLSPLRSLVRIEPDSAAEFIEVNNFACPNCPHLESYATVLRVTLKKGKDDKMIRSEKALVRFSPIDEETETFLFQPMPEPVVEAGGVEPAEELTK